MQAAFSSPFHPAGLQLGLGGGGKLTAQMAFWGVLVFPVVLGLITCTAHVLGGKPLQGVGIGKSFLPEDGCPTVLVRSAWYVLYRVHLKVTSLF